MVLDQGVRLEAPVSPHLAAMRAGTLLALDPLLSLAASQPDDARWIVEGAGGVLVPINRTSLMVDLIQQLGLPALVVTRTTLGTINHTLLTLEALRARRVSVAGVVMNGPEDADNRRSIETYGGVPVVGELPPLDPLSPSALADRSHLVDPARRLEAFLR